MPIKGKGLDPRAVAVGLTAVRLLEVDTEREGSLIVNSGTITLYLGHANTVTTATGIPLAAGASRWDDVTNNELWAIAGAATGGEARVEEVV